ncbi:MAG: 5-formyltetrahydrofolate cyclo-ligase [Gammaproteobacteria bacterium]|nr:5-formyltetrahydrofolate cyclo-ligase [Gammaproteobacteria bacterium]
MNAQSTPTTVSTLALRKSLREKRRCLSLMEQRQHARIITQKIIHSSLYKHSQHIALYLSGDGEVNLAHLIKQLHIHAKKCYLPVIISQQQGIIAFAPYEMGTHLKKNCFGILEPVFQKKNLKIAKQLDLVLTPLVGFDEQGNRIGMGGGFYDRALQHLNTVNQTNTLRPKQRPLKPKVLGIAHELQKVPQLQAQNWDIRLNAIVTEKRLTYFHGVE